MRALITGINGFAGGHLAEHLLAQGDQVLGAARSARWPARTPDQVRNLDVVTWDIARDDGLPPDAERRIAEFAPQCIYHLAAISVPAECGRDEPTPKAWAINVDGTRRVIDATLRLASRPRLIFVSSSHVYRPPRGEEPAVAESTPPEAGNAYGKTKQAAEALVAEAIAERGLDAVAIRAFQHAGPRQGTQMMLAQWAWQYASQPAGPIEVYNRDAWIDLTDVRDVVRSYRLLATKGNTGETYNVGLGRRLRTGDVLALLAETAGPERPIVELRPQRKYDPLADTRRVCGATGWRPEICVEQTVADTWAYFRGLERDGEQPA